jgi:hypothetical protein
MAALWPARRFSSPAGPVTEPTAEQKSLLQQLGFSLPERFELNRRCSADSVIA